MDSIKEAPWTRWVFYFFRIESIANGLDQGSALDKVGWRLGTGTVARFPLSPSTPSCDVLPLDGLVPWLRWTVVAFGDQPIPRSRRALAAVAQVQLPPSAQLPPSPPG
jgi:hypothetical protein